METRNRIKKAADEITQSTRTRTRTRKTSGPTRKDGLFLGTGSTLLNLAMSDKVDGGWPIGFINTMPGKSAAGKTMLILSAFCEACINPAFDDYRLIFDDTERRCDFDLNALFRPIVKRLETPSGLLYSDLKNNQHKSGISNTIEDMENTILTLLKNGQPFIYAADGLDAFTTEEEVEKEYARAVAAAKSAEAAKQIVQAHAARKAGIISRILRSINTPIADLQSGVIITQQLKQKQNAKAFETPWTTSGGQAPFYYSQVRPFLTRTGTIKESGCKIGITSKASLDKNSVTGKLRDVEFDIYTDLGIDDVASMVNFCLKQKHWKGGAWIEAPELGLKENGRDKLIRAIERQGKVSKLKRIVQRVWDKREDSLRLNRQSRY